MKQLIDMFEGLLDDDFDISDDVLSIDVLCKRVKNDMFMKPNGIALKQLPKLINHSMIPDSKLFTPDRYSYLRDYPIVTKLCHWICSKPKEWVMKYQTGELYTAFCNECLTNAGRKKSWVIKINPWRKPIGKLRDGDYKEIGRLVSVDLLTGSNWVSILRVGIEF